MQTALVFVLVAAAAFWMGRKLYLSLRPKKKDDGCDACH